MSQPSQWPLPPEGIRYALPPSVRTQLAQHPLTRRLYPWVFGYYPRARGHRMARTACHDDHVLIYSVAGKGRLRVDMQGQSRSWSVSPGQLIVLGPGMAHEYEAHPQDPWSIYWLHFRGSEVDGFLASLELDHLGPVAHLGVLPQLVADFQRLLGGRLGGSQPATAIHQALQVQSLLSYCALHGHRQREGRSQGRLDLDRIHSLMQRQVRGTLSLDDLAQSVGLSRHHFARLYRKTTGETPIRHFLELKMQHACFLLEVSDQPIQAIARELGYEDAYYFSRQFKQIVGVPPSHYRR